MANDILLDGPIVPVIFTTATLVTTETSLDSTDVQEGEIGSLEVQDKDWVWLDHNLTPDLRPNIRRVLRVADSKVRRGGPVQNAVKLDIARSVAIVTAKGIAGFVQTLPDLLHASDPL